MSGPLVSVVIVNWNGAKWLKKCLDSLEVQSYKNIEVVVVDNASTDGSVEYIKSHYPHVIQVLSSINKGFAGGNNLGIKKARGELIMLLNNDTWAEPHLVSKLVDFYSQNKFDVVAPREMKYETDAPEKLYTIQIDVIGHPHYIRNNVTKTDTKDFYLSGVCILFSKELYDATGGLDESFFMYFEEIDWFWRLQMAGKRIAHAPGIYVHHAGAGSTGTGIKYNSFLWRNENTLQMLLKNYSALNLLWVIPLYLVVNMLEIVVFLVVGKPKIASTYFKGWLFNLKHMRATISKRRTIQRQRVVGDRAVFKKMYIGLSKASHLIRYVGMRRSNPTRI